MVWRQQQEDLPWLNRHCKVHQPQKLSFYLQKKEKREKSLYWKWAYRLIKEWSMWCAMQILCRNGCLVTKVSNPAKRREKGCLISSFGFDRLFNQWVWRMFVEKLTVVDVAHPFCFSVVHDPSCVWTCEPSVEQRRFVQELQQIRQQSVNLVLCKKTKQEKIQLVSGLYRLLIKQHFNDWWW